MSDSSRSSLSYCDTDTSQGSNAAGQVVSDATTMRSLEWGNTLSTQMKEVNEELSQTKLDLRLLRTDSIVKDSKLVQDYKTYQTAILNHQRSLMCLAAADCLTAPDDRVDEEIFQADLASNEARLSEGSPALLAAHKTAEALLSARERVAAGLQEYARSSTPNSPIETSITPEDMLTLTDFAAENEIEKNMDPDDGVEQSRSGRRKRKMLELLRKLHRGCEMLSG